MDPTLREARTWDGEVKLALRCQLLAQVPSDTGTLQKELEMSKLGGIVLTDVMYYVVQQTSNVASSAPSYVTVQEDVLEGITSLDTHTYPTGFRVFEMRTFGLPLYFFLPSHSSQPNDELDVLQKTFSALPGVSCRVVVHNDAAERPSAADRTPSQCVAEAETHEAKPQTPEGQVKHGRSASAGVPMVTSPGITSPSPAPPDVTPPSTALVGVRLTREALEGSKRPLQTAESAAKSQALNDDGAETLRRAQAAALAFEQQLAQEKQRLHEVLEQSLRAASLDLALQEMEARCCVTSLETIKRNDILVALASTTYSLLTRSFSIELADTKKLHLTTVNNEGAIVPWSSDPVQPNELTQRTDGGREVADEFERAARIRLEKYFTSARHSLRERRIAAERDFEFRRFRELESEWTSERTSLESTLSNLREQLHSSEEQNRGLARQLDEMKQKQLAIIDRAQKRERELCFQLDQSLRSRPRASSTSVVAPSIARDANFAETSQPQPAATTPQTHPVDVASPPGDLGIPPLARRSTMLSVGREGSQPPQQQPRGNSFNFFSR